MRQPAGVAVFGRHHAEAPGDWQFTRRSDFKSFACTWYSAGVNSRVAHIDHIQIAAPAGCEAAARDFYGSILGLTEMEKPPALRARGGCWFECGSQQLHIGVERDFKAARKAHPAFAMPDLDGLRDLLTGRGVRISEDDNLPGARRFYAEDPWGNRLEFVQVSE
jgi:catechol 2,3-dioxygenase-like lactoylglutathione lyase family enzyme